MDAAQRVLMNEFKQLSKEKWTNIEVCLPVHAAKALQSCLGTSRVPS